MRFKVGMRVRVGGRRGCIMMITNIDGDDLVLKNMEHTSTFYFHKGDCSLIPIKEFEQLLLFQ